MEIVKTSAVIIELEAKGMHFDSSNSTFICNECILCFSDYPPASFFLVYFVVKNRLTFK